MVGVEVAPLPLDVVAARQPSPPSLRPLAGPRREPPRLALHRLFRNLLPTLAGQSRKAHSLRPPGSLEHVEGDFLTFLRGQRPGAALAGRSDTQRQGIALQLVESLHRLTFVRAVAVDQVDVCGRSRGSEGI